MASDRRFGGVPGVRGALVAITVAIATSAVGLAAAAPAAQPDAATRAAARDLAEQAETMYKAGDFAGALDKYQRAHALVPVTTLGLRIARCFLKLGRFVDASEQYLDVTRMELPPGALQVHKDAQVTAEAERNELQPRIPKVTIKLEGDADDMLLDGKPFPAALLDVARPIDPGKHKVELRRDTKKVTQEFTIAEGENKAVVVDANAAFANAGATPPTPEPVKPPEAPPKKAKPVAGFVLLGIGGVGLAAGTISGLLARGKITSLEAKCPDRSCPPDAWADADGYSRLRTISIIGFVVGATAAGAGAVLLLTAPSEKKSATTVQPYVGLGSVGFVGTFQ